MSRLMRSGSEETGRRGLSDKLIRVEFASQSHVHRLPSRHDDLPWRSQGDHHLHTRCRSLVLRELNLVQVCGLLRRAGPSLSLTSCGDREVAGSVRFKVNMALESIAVLPHCGGSKWLTAQDCGSREYARVYDRGRWRAPK